LKAAFLKGHCVGFADNRGASDFEGLFPLGFVESEVLTPDRLQKAFALCYRTGTGHVVLEWLVTELRQPIYSIGAPWETAVAQGIRLEIAELIVDMTRRGLSALESEAADACDG
jgi:hypothetical protein